MSCQPINCINVKYTKIQLYKKQEMSIVRKKLKYFS